MITLDNIFLEIGQSSALWCDATDKTDLAAAVAYAVEQKISMISVMPDDVATVWPWLEKSGINIFARFYIADKNASISEFATNVKNVFRHGAGGVQVFVPVDLLDWFTNQIQCICDDLFFNKHLVIALDVCKINAFDWPDIFSALKKINASALMLELPKDTGIKSEFVGRVYGGLDTWDKNFKGALHFATGTDLSRIDQAFRLVSMLQPELLQNARFFINY